MEGSDLVRAVTTDSAFDWPEEDPGEFGIEPGQRARRRLKIAAYDFGMKWNILRRLSAHNCDVRVYPATVPASEVLASKPDGVFLSNGPGDPAPLSYAIENSRQIVAANVPTFGICLGHQILGLALGGNTYKLKFGHRGANHPVKRLETGKIEITSQNHGFAVDPQTLPEDVAVTHINLYDQTVEGLRHRTRPVFSVQYHPEASPGPHDADYLFSDFIQLIESRS
jgi:carbamoyl-phosphate synthase small subunit